MRRRLSLVFTLVAWLLATGSHWDLVQTFGWGRMIATYSRSMSFKEAVRLTFTPDNLCGVCSAVAAAKQKQDAHGAPLDRLATKVLLVYTPAPAPIVAAPGVSRWWPDEASMPASERSAPPVPPPRVAAA